MSAMKQVAPMPTHKADEEPHQRIPLRHMPSISTIDSQAVAHTQIMDRLHKTADDISPVVRLRRHMAANPVTYQSAKEDTRWFLDDARANIQVGFDDILMLTSVYVLFADDVRLLAFGPVSDSTFEILSSIALFMFIVELLLNCWAKTTYDKTNKRRLQGYMFSFFFWLDVVAILSLVPDIPWIAEGMGVGSDFSMGTGVAKAGRVVRMARLVRLVRLYKIASTKRREKKLMEELQELVEQGIVDQSELNKKSKLYSTRQTKLGAELSDTTIRRVIVIVLIMLCLVPVLTPHDGNRVEHYSVNLLHDLNLANDHEGLEAAVYALDNFDRGVFGDAHILLGLKASPTFSKQEADEYDRKESREHKRSLEKQTKEKTAWVNGTEYRTRLVLNREPVVEMLAQNHVLLTVFISVILVLGAMQFSADARKLVLEPIERMMNLVEVVAMDPLADISEIMGGKDDDTHQSGEYETLLLESTIEKITGMLRVGFGEAGANIISENLTFTEGSSTALDPMIAGRRVFAIFGFCDIHHFDTITAVLQSEVMTFVNQVASIVHSRVSKWGGQCNKNLGNAFLMVWRIGDEQEIQEAMTQGTSSSISRRTGTQFVHKIDLLRVPGVDILADKALVGFLKTIVEINRNKTVQSYARHKKMMRGFPDGYRLSMGFGMHAGWAIEGAVGSVQKIDATYLSPHVNMAARMETASRQYGVSTLFTEDFHKLLSKNGQAKCRKVDRVTVKGSAEKKPIYTYDTLELQSFDDIQGPRIKRSAYTPNIWETDGELLSLQNHVDISFRELFAQGVEDYIKGEWDYALEALHRCDEMMREKGLPGDGPSQTLIRFMSKGKPENWSGFRPLTNK